MNNRRNGLFRNSLFYILMFLSLMGIIYFFFGGNSGSQTQNIRYSEFVKQLDKNNVKNVSIQPSGGVYKVTGSYRKARTTSSANALGIRAHLQRRRHFQQRCWKTTPRLTKFLSWRLSMTSRLRLRPKNLAVSGSRY